MIWTEIFNYEANEWPSYLIALLFFFNVSESLLFALLGKDITFVQKKPSLRPEWNSCFDAHLYEGRAVRMTLRHRPDVEVGQLIFTAQSLADRCRDGDIASVWVCMLFG
jgi:hypothetical protein